MNAYFRLLLVWTAFQFYGVSAIPPVGQLLPSDTIGFVSTTDWQKAEAAWKSNNLGRLWANPSMQSFRSKLEERFRQEVITRYEQQLGIKLADYTSLARGQITLASVRAGWQPNNGSLPPWVLIVDTGDRSATAKALIADTAKRLRAANKTVQSTKIRQLEFQTLVLTPEDLQKLSNTGTAAPSSADDDEDEDDAPKSRLAAGPKNFSVTFGLAGDAILIGSSTGALERVVAKLTGSDAESLQSTERFEAARQSVLKEGVIQGWLDITAFTSEMAQSLGGVLAMTGADPRKAIAALGIEAARWGAVSLQEGPEGTTVHASLAVPESSRTGIFKLIQADAKESSPPAFIARETVKFHRWRLNGPRFWKTLEDTLTQISPQLMGVLRLTLDSAGQQEDPNFTFKTEFVDRLGDDLITFEKAPRGKTLTELNNPPSMVLLGSPKPERLVNGLRAFLVMAQVQSGGNGVSVREFLGRKIYSARLAVPGAGKTGGHMHMAAGTSYVALSSDASLVEEFLRASDDSSKSLREFPGLSSAAERIGGMNTGLFMFENQLESSRASWELLRKGGSLDKVMPPGTANLDTARLVSQWADFSLLPEFEKIARHFTFGVLVGSSDAQVFRIKWFSPAAR
jgi:hypothetical protein